jgi:hypothetical protein
MKYDTIPVANEDNNITKGNIPNLGNKSKLAKYKALKIMQGSNIYITILLKGSMSFSLKKSILLRKYPSPIIMMIDKIVTIIAFIKLILLKKV